MKNSKLLRYKSQYEKKERSAFTAHRDKVKNTLLHEFDSVAPLDEYLGTAKELKKPPYVAYTDPLDRDKHIRHHRKKSAQSPGRSSFVADPGQPLFPIGSVA